MTIFNLNKKKMKYIWGVEIDTEAVSWQVDKLYDL